MASIYPSDISESQDSPQKSMELATLVALRDGLSNDYSVYHSVHWSKARTQVTMFGEIDFVIANSDGELLVIEQKNGPLEFMTA